ncbi:hypothetical protein H5410_002241 [Solanum commersonii]|uniref:Uncharacterized protein n=1 Tax=Solanum commersonii TaxID=4109 RepID=A0A9J6B1I5_SOLCO|nr:hypothetical protein H5410_002241 [Solanum commersonii]
MQQQSLMGCSIEKTSKIVAQRLEARGGRDRGRGGGTWGGASRLGRGRGGASVQDAWGEAFGQDASRPRDRARGPRGMTHQGRGGEEGGNASSPEAQREWRGFGQDASRSGDEGTSEHDPSRSGWGVCGGKGARCLESKGGVGGPRGKMPRGQGWAVRASRPRGGTGGPWGKIPQGQGRGVGSLGKDASRPRGMAGGLGARHLEARGAFGQNTSREDLGAQRHDAGGRREEVSWVSTPRGRVTGLKLFILAGAMVWPSISDTGTTWVKLRHASSVLYVPPRLKGKFYRVVVRLILSYGTKCWPIKNVHVQKMNVVEMRMLR